MTYPRKSPPNNALRVYFQPILDLRIHDCHAHEALARWETSLGVLSAAEVIQMARDLGISRALNLHLWEYAASHSPMRRISVNASPWDVVSQLPELLRCVEDAQNLGTQFIVEVPHPPGRISEQVHLQRSIAQLKRAGVPVWATDHGFGADVAENLLELPLDGIKVDCSHRNDLEFLVATVQHIHDLGAKAIAEKIELETLSQQVRAAGFDYGQGHYLGVPKPTEQIGCVALPR